MLSEEIKLCINNSVLCWLATEQAGQASVSPKEVFSHFSDSDIIIAHIASPQSIANIRRNPKVCVSFIEIFRQKGWQIYGTARLVTRSQQNFAAMAAPLQAIAGVNFPFTTIIKVPAETIKPIIAPSYRKFPKYQRGCDGCRSNADLWRQTTALRLLKAPTNTQMFKLVSGRDLKSPKR